MLVLHIRSLGSNTLAGSLYEQQQEMGWPGLVVETGQICRDLMIDDCNTTTISKKAYRKLVSAACHQKNEERMRAQAAGKPKCDRIMSEAYGKKEYISRKLIHEVRQIYRTRVKLQPFAGNYSRDKKFEKTQFLCRCLNSREDESHLLSGICPIYSDIHEKFKNFDEDDDLVEFFNLVLA